jgi:ActR/RegA family two-component response regulator
VDLLPPAIAGAARESGSRFEHFTNDELLSAREIAIRNVEQEFLAGLMKRCSGNVSQAARNAGMQRGYLQRLLARYRRSEE